MASLCEDCRRRYEENPMRVFDCKVEEDRRRLAEAPTSLDHLCAVCRGHFDSFRAHLGRLGLAYRVDPRLVRGLDYYVRTAFEVVAEQGLGSQNSLMGGGRYDGLVRELGGPEVAGFGWALGIERLMLLLGAAAEEGAAPRIDARSDVFIVHLGEAARDLSTTIARDLRARNLSVRLDPRAAKIAAQMKRADREGARFVLILGDDEIGKGVYKLKNMKTGEQQPVRAGALDELWARIRS